MADIGDLLIINAMGENNSIRSRAKSLEDNSGVKVEDISSYRNRNGGFGIMKALGYAALGLAAGVALAAVGVEVGVAVMVAQAGIAIGGIIGGLSMLAQHEKVMNGYSAYLDDVSAQVRDVKAKSPARENQVSPQEAAELKARLAALEAKSYAQTAAQQTQTTAQR